MLACSLPTSGAWSGCPCASASGLCARARGWDPKSVTASIIVIQTQDLVYLPSLFSHSCIFPQLDVLSFGGSLPDATLVGACKHTVACSNLDRELDFFHGWVESGFGEAEPVVVGGKLHQTSSALTNQQRRASEEGEGLRVA